MADVVGDEGEYADVDGVEQEEPHDVAEGNVPRSSQSNQLVQSQLHVRLVLVVHRIQNGGLVCGVNIIVVHIECLLRSVIQVEWARSLRLLLLLYYCPLDMFIG